MPPENRASEVFYDWFETVYSPCAKASVFDLMRSFVKLYAHGADEYVKDFLSPVE